MPKTTDELMKVLQNKKDLQSYLQENREEMSVPSLAEMLHNLLSRSNMNKSDLLRAAHIDRVYGYQILNGQRLSPSRDKLLRLAFALQANVTDTQRLLRAGGQPILYPRDVRDALILFQLQNGHTLYDCEAALEDAGLKSLED